MQRGQRIWKDCGKCKGTGSLWVSPTYAHLHSPPAPVTDPTTAYTEVDCLVCEGLGAVPWGWLRDEKEETMPGEEA